MARAKTMSGILYGLGVGPGDPELMTVKAWRLIATADVIAYLCAEGQESRAYKIAKPFLPEKFEQIEIIMPMKVEREPGQKAYDAGAKRIAEALDSSKNVVMLCEGDPFFYGSFMYIFDRLEKTHTVQIVPGVTSIAAAAAELRTPLVERDEVLKILPASMDEAQLETELSSTNAAAIIKVGRHFGKLRRILAAQNLLHHATAIENATLENQTITPFTEITSDTMPYFTTIIVRRP